MLRMCRHIFYRKEEDHIFVLLLPYLQEQIHSKATTKYAMDKAKEVSSFF